MTDKHVSDANEKAISEGSSWSELKSLLKRKLENVIHQQHHISVLNKCKQRRHETEDTYGDRYTEVAKESQITYQDILVY